jgi:alpha-methylacyl-CoA racemase
MSGPLDGLKVIELAGIGPGPYACMLLADLGADVLRLERGDVTTAPTSTSTFLHRSRPSVAIDLKNATGRDLVLELAEQADVLIEGFRPGVTERLGLGPIEIAKRNRRLVYGRMTGFGQEGPLAARAGHDINYIAVSGALWPLGRANDRPVPPMNLLGDFGGALFLVFGVMAAVFKARETGEGQVVDAAMVDSSASMLTMMYGFLNGGRWEEVRGTNFLDTGAHFYEVYETQDQKFMAVGAIEPKFYAALLKGLSLDEKDLPEQWDQSQWTNMKQRLASAFRTKTRDEWAKIFDSVDACVTPVLSPLEAPNHPYNAARNVFTRGASVQPQPAPRFSATPGAIGQPPQNPGANTRTGLAHWGIGADRFEELRRVGAFG